MSSLVPSLNHPRLPQADLPPEEMRIETNLYPPTLGILLVIILSAIVCPGISLCTNFPCSGNPPTPIPAFNSSKLISSPNLPAPKGFNFFMYTPDHLIVPSSTILGSSSFVFDEEEGSEGEAESSSGSLTLQASISLLDLEGWFLGPEGRMLARPSRRASLQRTACF